MKKAIAVFIVFVMIVGLFAACGNGNGGATTSAPTTPSTDGNQAATTADTIQIAVGHVLAESHPYHRGLVELQRVLDEMRPGAVQLNIFPNSTLGGERDKLEGMQMGTVDAALISTASLGAFLDAFQIFDLPFLFTSHEAAYYVLDGQFGQDLLDLLPDIGIVGIAYWENGFRYISHDTDNDIILPTDIPSGLRIRTMENEIQMQSFITLGANAIPMAWGEVYTSLQQGTIDGQENPLANVYASNLQEVQSRISMTGHVYAPAPFIFSKQVWDSWPEDIQELLTEAILAVRDTQRQMVADDEVELIEYFRGLGMSIITPDQIDMAAWRAATQPVWDTFGPRIGQDKIDELTELIARFS